MNPIAGFRWWGARWLALPPDLTACWGGFFWGLDSAIEIVSGSTSGIAVIGIFGFVVFLSHIIAMNFNGKVLQYWDRPASFTLASVFYSMIVFLLVIHAAELWAIGIFFTVLVKCLFHGWLTPVGSPGFWGKRFNG